MRPEPEAAESDVAEEDRRRGRRRDRATALVLTLGVGAALAGGGPHQADQNSGAGRSSLLRLDNRGVCIACHDPTDG